MGKIQCPNCNSFDTSEKTPPLVGCGCGSLFLSFILLGGGAGAAEFYGGTFTSSPLLGLFLLIVGLVLIIIGYIKNSNKKILDYECKNCKNEFKVK